MYTTDRIETSGQVKLRSATSSARILFSALFGLLLSGPAFQAQTSSILRSPDSLPDQYIVVLRDSAAHSSMEAASMGPRVPEVASDMASTHAGVVGFVYESALKGFSVTMSADQAERLAQDPRVEYIQEDGIVSLDVDGTVSVESVQQLSATWGLDRIDQRDRPLSGTYVYGTRASNVHVYVIDTGIRATHVEFRGRVSFGYTAIGDGQGVNDCHGHGTHVAGTIGGSKYGVAKGVTLHPVRVLDCNGSGPTSGVIAGIDWVTANRQSPAVANMSLGGGANKALDDAVTRSINRGVFYAVAAGNAGSDACLFSPARTPEATTVAGSNSTDYRVASSHMGPCVDIFAPGGSITSSFKTSDTATATMTGTSMASPHVAGVAALILSAYPTATPAFVNSKLMELATTGRLLDVRSGSPNTLLMTYMPPPCTLPEVSPVSVKFRARGGSDRVNVAVQDGCAWTAKSNVAWVTITGSSSGTGSAVITYSVSKNRGSRKRTGTITVAGRTVTIVQKASS